MFFFQYFSFPLSVSFHHCSILINLPPTLYNVFLPVLQFSPASIIPPLLRTHSFISHPRCIMFFSQYFCFPLSVSFHHCSILIHSSTTHTYNVFLPALQFSPCQYHSTIAPYSFIHLPPTLYMFFSQYFSFPQSVSFHHCSILIHSSTTHVV